MLAAWYAYPQDETEDAKLVLARRFKGNIDWEHSGTVLKNLSYSAGNPVIYETASGDLWYLFVILKGKYWDDVEFQGARSTDGGRTWSHPSVMWNGRGMMVRHSPVLAGNDRLLLPAYREDLKRSVILCSEPPYMKWRELYTFEDLALIQPTLVREHNGRLSIFFRPTDEPHLIWRSHSDDNGVSWGPPVRTPLPNPLSGLDAFALGEKIAAVYNHTKEHIRSPLSIAVSADSGISWSEPWDIDTAPHELSYPHFIYDEESRRVHGVYTYNRRMIKYVSFSAEELD